MLKVELEVGKHLAIGVVRGYRFNFLYTGAMHHILQFGGMKNLLLLGGLLAALASCQPTGPKFKVPVVVNANNAPIHENMAPDSPVLMMANKGDTLEFEGMATSELCTVKPDAHGGRFPKIAGIGYINRKYLTSTPKAVGK
jgi:hypothetical protein